MEHNLYLLGEDYQSFRDFDVRSRDPEYQLLQNLSAVSDFEYQFYLKTHEVKPLRWVKFFENHVKLSIDELVNEAYSYIVLIRMTFGEITRIFAIVGNQGWRLIKEEDKELGFGLRIALNFLLRDGIKAGFAKKLAGDSKQKSITLSNPSKIFELEFDEHLDLVTRLSGKSKDRKIATSLNGSDSLKIRTKNKFDDFSAIIETAFREFNSNEYLDDYGFVDKIRPIGRNSGIKSELSDRVIAKLNSKDLSATSLVHPDDRFQDDSFTWQFQYRSAEPVTAEFLELDVVLQMMENLDSGHEFTLDEVRNSQVLSITPIQDGEVIPLQKLSLYELLSIEVTFNGQVFVLQNSKWYYVNQNYLDMLNEELSRLTIKNENRLPAWNRERGSRRDKYISEGIYIERLTKSIKNFFPLDKRLFRPKDISPYAKIELCDFITDQNQFVCLKRGDNSQRLSYLFNQGLVAFDTLFVHAKNQVLQFLQLKLENNANRSYVRYKNLTKNELRDLQLVFAIGTNKHIEDLPAKFPFFSKVILFGLIERVASYTDRPVEIWHIPLS